MLGNDHQGDAGKLKVFISYSRKDVDFADDLELFLDTRGFDPIIDRHDIDHNDDWQARLYELIHGCDVVVFVLTETSAASPICKWEVDEAAKLGKRRLVVTPGPLPAGTQPPEALGAANWIHCWRNPTVPDSSIAKGKKDLERALKADVVWLRERTRLMEQAAAWSARGGATDSPLLLRGDLLTDAQKWAHATPRDETLPDAVARFLSASEAHEARVKAETEAGLAEKQAAVDAAARASRRVRRVSLIGAGVAAAFLVAAVAAGWIAMQVRSDADRYQAEATTNLDRVRAQEKTIEASRRALTDKEREAQQKSEEAAANLLEAQTQQELAAANLSEAERQGYLAAEGLSNQMAQQADGFVGEQTHERAALMALYADPTAAGSAAARKLGGTRGFPVARATLAAVIANMPAGRALTGHGDYVHAAAFSPDGRFIVTGSVPIVAGSSDNTARIWDAATGKEMRRLEGHGGSVLAAAFSPDGRFIVTGSWDKTARIWEVPEIMRVPAKRQVEIGCQRLWQVNAPLAFSGADVATLAVLRGIAEDKENPGFLVSPCKGVLPAAAFAKAG